MKQKAEDTEENRSCRRSYKIKKKHIKLESMQNAAEIKI